MKNIICIISLLQLIAVAGFSKEGKVPLNYFNKNVLFYYNKILEYRKQQFRIILSDEGFTIQTSETSPSFYISGIYGSIPNGYLNMQYGPDGHRSVAYFADINKVPYIMIEETLYVSHYDNEKKQIIEFLTPDGNKWIDIKNKVFPSLTYRDFISDKGYKPGRNITKFIKIYYTLPEVGTSIFAEINTDELRYLTTGRELETADLVPVDSPEYRNNIEKKRLIDAVVVKEIKSFLEKIGKHKIELKWDKQKKVFTR